MREIAFLALFPLASGVAAVALGKTGDWDSLNYHWYNAYAFLHGRLGFDVAVAHHATYYNPLPDLPFYAIAQISSWLALLLLGAVQGLNALPLYYLARTSLTGPDRKLTAGFLTLAGMLGGTAIGMIGRTSNDNVLSIFVLSGLAVLITQAPRLRTGRRDGLIGIALTGFLIGCAGGLKLVDMFYAIGFAAALLIIPGTLKDRAQRALAGLIGGVCGVLFFGGYWFWALYAATGNPFFPYFNHVFHSPLISADSFRDTRFIADSAWKLIAFPYLYTANFKVADDTPFRDLHVMFAYTLIPVAVAVWALGRRVAAPMVRPEAARLLFAFAGASYAAWIVVFAIHRYISALELLGPLLIASAIGFFPVSLRAQRAILVSVLLIAALGEKPDFSPRARASDPYVQLQSFPGIARPNDTLIVMTGLQPLAYLIPSLPPNIPVLRISGWLAAPADHSQMTAQMQARVAAHRGDVLLLASDFEIEWAAKDLAAYGLGLDVATCPIFQSNLGGPYRLCLLKRLS